MDKGRFHKGCRGRRHNRRHWHIWQCLYSNHCRHICYHRRPAKGRLFYHTKDWPVIPRIYIQLNQLYKIWIQYCRWPLLWPWCWKRRHRRSYRSDRGLFWRNSKGYIRFRLWYAYWQYLYSAEERAVYNRVFLHDNRCWFIQLPDIFRISCSKWA